MENHNQYAQNKLLEHNKNYTLIHGKQPLVYLKSFGCQQNVSDGEKIKGKLAEIGFGFTDFLEITSAMN